MKTRSPFILPGLEVQSKVGERGLFENAIRWSQVFKNKKGEDAFGYKLNFYILQARDWEANNLDSSHASINDKNNPGGYDAVNIYGDEYNGRGDFASYAKIRPGLGIFYRTGYPEKDLVDYNTKNIKANAAFHYKIKPETEIILASSFGSGTTIYQGDNRYCLKNILFYQNRIELTKTDKYFVRLYATNEDAGKTYDAFFTALLLQQASKKDQYWYSDYEAIWSQYSQAIKSLPGFPAPPTLPYTPEQYISWITSINPFLINNYSSTLASYHDSARNFADGIGNPINLGKPFFKPGTTQFDSAFNAITTHYSYSEGGSRFYDKSALYHAQGEYKFTPAFAEIIVGGNYRLYAPRSNGTIFIDTNERKITNKEYGFYSGLEKKYFAQKLKINLTCRLDKNDNFKFLFSPAASAVYTFNANHTLRFSFSSAIRNPTLSDQYVYYNVGRATLVGNLNGFDSLVTIPSLISALEHSKDSLKYFTVDPLQPEKVKTFELGYRATLFKNIFLDVGYYYSYYNDFIGYKIGSRVRVTPLQTIIVDSIYRVSANAIDQVTTQGIALGINYYFKKYFSLYGNYSLNKLDRHGSTDPLIPAFNTPENKFNIGLNGRDIDSYFTLLNKLWKKLPSIKIHNYGFSINYKWIQGFLFEGSPQFTGYVTSYDRVDIQINKKVPKMSCTFKIGASNVLNNFTYEVYGGPSVGRLAYFSVLYEMKRKQ